MIKKIISYLLEFVVCNHYWYQNSSYLPVGWLASKEKLLKLKKKEIKDCS